MSQAFLVLAIILFLFGIGVAVAALVSVRRRRQALAGWAFSHGLDFHPAHDSGFGDRYPHFPCLNKGKDRYACNVMQGRLGNYRLCAFDYHYYSRYSGRDDGSSYQFFSAVIVTTSLPMKPLVIRQKKDFDRVAAMIGFEGVEFEWGAFNKEFHVTSLDHRWAFDVLPQATMEFLMNSPKFVLEFQLCQIIAYRDTLFQPADFESAVQVIEGILSRLPTSLVQELQGVEE